MALTLPSFVLAGSDLSLIVHLLCHFSPFPVLRRLLNFRNSLSAGGDCSAPPIQAKHRGCDQQAVEISNRHFQCRFLFYEQRPKKFSSSDGEHFGVYRCRIDCDITSRLAFVECSGTKLRVWRRWNSQGRSSTDTFCLTRW